MGWWFKNIYDIYSLCLSYWCADFYTCLNNNSTGVAYLKRDQCCKAFDAGWYPECQDCARELTAFESCKTYNSCTDSICPECDDKDGLVYQDGCLTCTSCGYSKCG